MNITFAQLIAFLGVSKEEGERLLAQLAAKYPDGAATIDEIMAIAAPYVTPSHIANRVAAGLVEGWNTIRKGKGPARVNPTSHFI